MVLPIKKKWYDMILSGEKKEEYRKISPYYTTRFENLWGEDFNRSSEVKKEILLRNGYSSKSPTSKVIVTLSKGFGNTNWGAEQNVTYYILKIHSIS